MRFEWYLDSMKLQHSSKVIYWHSFAMAIHISTCYKQNIKYHHSNFKCSEMVDSWNLNDWHLNSIKLQYSSKGIHWQRSAMAIHINTVWKNNIHHILTWQFQILPTCQYFRFEWHDIFIVWSFSTPVKVYIDTVSQWRFTSTQFEKSTEYLHSNSPILWNCY